ncbi:MAG: hypothetical protein HJJLKODD_02015 [Phycisphaerae bacterium]|nr:hypothetical protein [Phycisphaerae bacterium]
MSMIRRSGWLSLSLAAMTLVGCGGVTYVPPVNLPDEIEFVRDNRGDFAQSADDVLAETEPGTVIDPLTNIVGCWGSFAQIDITNGSQTLPSDDYQYFRYNEDESFEYQVLSVAEDPSIGEIEIYAGRSGTYVLSGDNGLAVTVTENEVSNPSTGEIQTVAQDNQEPVDYVVSISGGELRLVLAERAESGDLADRDNIVLKRFDCLD